MKDFVQIHREPVLAPRHIEPRLGVDIGRVLISAGSGAQDTAFLSGSEADALRTPPMPGAFEAMRGLVEQFEGRAWLVSKCGPRIQQRTLRWLSHWDFYRETGVQPGAVLFCRERRQKAIHCRAQRITHFVDDRADVLGHLRGLVPWLFLYGPQRRAAGPAPGDWRVPVLNWAEAREAIERTLPSAGALPRGAR